MVIGQKIAPCLWFDNQGEEAAKFYVSIFKNSRIRYIGRYGEAGRETHGRPVGSVMTVEFELEGQSFTALNGGPIFKLSEAMSLQVYVENQEELDYYWDRLSAGGNPESQVCGWLKDKFGLSWQVVPKSLVTLFGDPDNPGSQRAMAALMQMKKLDIAALEKAYRG
jgi:predicted 3-demethylubiquinone-9 3-methyltransferase (glyoxalase superfamily)